MATDSSHRSAPTARPARAAARRSSSARRAVDARGLQLLPEHRGARGRDAARASARWPSCSTTISPLQLLATGRVQGEPLHAGRPAAVPLRRRHLDRVDRRSSTTAAPRVAERGQRRLRLLAAAARCSAPAPPAADAARGRDHRRRRQELHRRLQRAGRADRRRRASCRGCRPSGRPFAVVELRSAAGRGLHLDYDTRPAERLRSAARCGSRTCSSPACATRSAKEETGRAASTAPTAARRSRSSWPTARASPAARASSIIDLTQGIGGELRACAQDEPVQPADPAGQHRPAAGRCTGRWSASSTAWAREPGDDEQFGWDEYLLYNRQRGFSFLVDARTAGAWSSRPPARPSMAGSGRSASYLGTSYQLQYAYNAETTYVPASSTGRSSAARRPSTATSPTATALLSMERSADELTWSAGSTIDSRAVVAGLQARRAGSDLFKRADAVAAERARAASAAAPSSFVVLVAASWCCC